MINAVRFLDNVIESLISGKSVVLNFPNEVPWQNMLIDILTRRIDIFSDNRTFDEFYCQKVNDPGEFLFNKYCNEAEKAKYIPIKTYEQFLANNNNIVLNHRYVYLSGISSAYANLWIESVNEYLECCDKNSEHGIFIIVTNNANVHTSENIDCHNYADYITDYDCLMLCMTIISSEKCSSIQKQYIAELASNIADNKIEIASKLAEDGINLMKQPLKTAVLLFNKNNNTKENSIDYIIEKIKTSIWQTQIKIAFPKLEQFRKDFIQKYQNRLKMKLPVMSCNGDRVDNISELEIGQLYYICHSNKISEKADLDMLKKMKDARNKLAHLNIISYQEMTVLGIL